MEDEKNHPEAIWDTLEYIQHFYGLADGVIFLIVLLTRVLIWKKIISLDDIYPEIEKIVSKKRSILRGQSGKIIVLEKFLRKVKNQ